MVSFTPERFVGADLPALLEELADRQPPEPPPATPPPRLPKPVQDDSAVKSYRAPRSAPPDRSFAPPPRPSSLSAGVTLSVPAVSKYDATVSQPRESLTRSWLEQTTDLHPEQTLGAADHPDVEAADVELKRLLGRGAQGAVYLARLKTSGLFVAVKVFDSRSESAESPAVREVRIASKLRHPNVIRLFGCHRAGRHWVVVMELLQGRPLSGNELLRRELRDVAMPLADAILALASARVVHCDIKPANIVRRADGSPVLIDFGIAIDLDATPASQSFGGTPLFMPREAFQSGRPEPSWDAYALGVTILTLHDRDRLPAFTSSAEFLLHKINGTFDDMLDRAARRIRDRPLRDSCRGLISMPAKRLRYLHQLRRLDTPSWWQRWTAFLRAR